MRLTVLLSMLMLIVAVTAAVQGQPAAASQPARTAGQPATKASAAGEVQRADALPVRRVVLYKNGIGYFEHLGRVRGNQTVTVDFTSGQLNDVLKSLTTLDLGGGRITGITYNSEAPLSQQLAALGLPLGAVDSAGAFFGALRGARLEARTPAGIVSGRLLAVEKRQRVGGDKGTEETDVLSIVTDGGEVRLVELSPAVSIRLADRDLNLQVGRYLGVVASGLQQSMRRMTISTAGTGERPLLVSYVSEVPVWKTTYRLVLPSKAGAQPFLQGWAIVDNTIGEDWAGVELSLVAGAPQSFIQQISQPYYVRRPVIPLPESALLTPQTHQAAVSGESGTTTGQETEAKDATRVLGSLQEVASVTRAAPMAAPPSPRLRASAGVAGGVVGGVPEVADSLRAVQPAALGRELGDLFEYRIKEPVTIRKNQSAMVPILNNEVALEKVTIWNPTGANVVPLRAVWLTNSTGLTLDGGSFTVVESDAFAGEGLIEALKPGEKRLLSYAADTAVHVDAKTDGGPRRIERIQVVRGVIIQTVQDRERRVYTVRNEDSTPRVVVIEHAARPGWILSGDTPQPAESSAGFHRFRLTIEPRKGASLTVEESYPRDVRVSIASMTDDQLAVFLRGAGATAAVQAALKPIVDKKQAIAAFARDLAARQAETSRIADDQERVRENMKALKGSAEEKALVQRYARQLDEQENRLEVLRKETAALEQQRSQAQAELDKLIEALALDITV
jgi:hypothetical protein